jgi:hypothetical protein
MFYGGWQDMHAIRQFVDRDGDSFDLLGAVLPSFPGAALGMMPLAVREAITAGRDLSSAELEWFEDKFLVMQKEIFDDLAWQHEAYMLGGVGLMRDIHQRHPDELDARTLVAWDDIGSGDPELVAGGNEHLLRREQEQVIQEHYDEMRDYHGPVGDTATYAFSVMAENPLPGGEAYRNYDPITLEADIGPPDVELFDPLGPLSPWEGITIWDSPDVHVEEELPLPAGNLSNFDDRWNWIENDMLPAYRELLAQPGAAEAMVSAPVDERAADYRKFPDFPYPGD